MSSKVWTKQMLEELYDLRKNKELSWIEVAMELSKSGTLVTHESARKRFNRVDWEKFFNEKEEPIKKSEWSQQDMIILHTYIDAGKSYSYIADKIGRSVTAVERKTQTTDWAAWQQLTFNPNPEEESESDDEQLIENLTNAMVSLSRHNYCRIQDMRKDDFLERININEKDLPLSFTEIKKMATQSLDECGLGNEESINLGEGTYIIVGDSHGKHTKRKMFDLIEKVNDFFDADKIIHIGHILDDDNEISFKWGDIDNLIVLAKGEELKFVHKKRYAYNFSYDIVRSEISLGKDLSIVNQDLISDYVKTPIRSLDNELFDGKMIVNCHRMEMSSKAAADQSANYICSPGSLCERHIIRTIKQIDFQDNRTVKVAYHDGFTKYRRMKHNYKYWNQGLLVVNVDKDGNHTVIPCAIKELENGYATSYFDKIISNKGVFDPDKKICIHADMHSPCYDKAILDIQEQICEDYKPDTLVNIGDAFSVNALSHWELDRGYPIFLDFLEECAKTHFVMKRMSKWAKERHAIIGNHERFIEDFVKKFPQLTTMLDFIFACDLKSLGYEITSLKEVLEIGDAKFIHGDMRFYNQSGTVLEKASRTLGHNTFIGHIHYPSIRFGCYSVGFAGLIDQGYNETEASAWIHGIGFCNQYKGLSWPSTVAIFNEKIVINDKTYSPRDLSSWEPKGFEARIKYSYGNQEPNS